MGDVSTDVEACAVGFSIAARAAASNEKTNLVIGTLPGSGAAWRSLEIDGVRLRLCTRPLPDAAVPLDAALLTKHARDGEAEADDARSADERARLTLPLTLCRL